MSMPKNHTESADLCQGISLPPYGIVRNEAYLFLGPDGDPDHFLQFNQFFLVSLTSYHENVMKIRP